MASIEIPETFIATRASTTLPQVLGSVSAAVELGLTQLSKQLPEHLVAVDGDINELTFTIHEAKNRGRLREPARAYRVKVIVEVEELKREPAHKLA